MFHATIAKDQMDCCRRLSLAWFVLSLEQGRSLWEGFRSEEFYQGLQITSLSLAVLEVP